jgi:hypothetical protein
MQCRKKGSGLDLEGVASHLGDTPGNAESVEWFERKDFQDEHVKRALQEWGICRRRRLHIEILFMQIFYTKAAEVSSVLFGIV